MYLYVLLFDLEVIALRKKKNKQKISKQWQSLDNINKNIIVYLAYATPPVSIDDIIFLSSLSPVKALNLMEDFKKSGFVCEKDKTGKGIYYPGDIDLKDYTKKTIPPEELLNILKETSQFQKSQTLRGIF